MEKININKIRGEWIESKPKNGGFIALAGGNDTIKSIQMVAEKVNEIIDYLSSKNNS